MSLSAEMTKTLNGLTHKQLVKLAQTGGYRFGCDYMKLDKQELFTRVHAWADRQYVGRNQLDAASLDRFYVIPMDYDNELESSLYGIESKSQTVSQTPCAMTVQEWVAYVQQVRKAVGTFGGAIRHIVSMRA